MSTTLTTALPPASSGPVFTTSATGLPVATAPTAAAPTAAAPANIPQQIAVAQPRVEELLAQVNARATEYKAALVRISPAAIRAVEITQNNKENNPVGIGHLFSDDSPGLGLLQALGQAAPFAALMGMNPFASMFGDDSDSKGTVVVRRVTIRGEAGKQLEAGMTKLGELETALRDIFVSHLQKPGFLNYALSLQNDLSSEKDPVVQALVQALLKQRPSEATAQADFANNLVRANSATVQNIVKEASASYISNLVSADQQAVANVATVGLLQAHKAVATYAGMNKVEAKGPESVLMTVLSKVMSIIGLHQEKVSQAAEAADKAGRPELFRAISQVFAEQASNPELS